MKRIFLIIMGLLLCWSSANAAQVMLKTDASPTQERSVNTEFGVQNTMNTELYTLTGRSVKTWLTGGAYTAGSSLVGNDGNLFTCTSTHTAGSTTEPGVGASWQTVWTFWGAAIYQPIQTAASQAEMEAGSETALRSMSPLRVAQAIAALAGGGTDDQTITAFSLLGTTITLTIEDGNSVELDLAPLQDGTGTDDQTITDFSLAGNVLSMTLEGGNTATIDLTPILGGGSVTVVQDLGTPSTTSVPSVDAVKAADDLKQNTADVVEADVDDVTLVKTGTTSITLSVKDAGISEAKIATGAVAPSKLKDGDYGDISVASGVVTVDGGGGTGYVATPTYSDESCTLGQRSFDASYIYLCEATDTWDRIAVMFTSWSNPSPAPSVVIIDSYDGGTSARLLSDYALGQGPHALGGSNLYSVSLKAGTGTATGTVTCRIGEQLDLSSVYTEEFSVNFTGVAGDWIEVLSSTQPAMTTAYWACTSDAAINVSYDTVDNHAGSSYIWDNYPGWVLEANTSRDMNFRVKVLQ